MTNKQIVSLDLKADKSKSLAYKKKVFGWTLVSPTFIALLLLAVGPMLFIFYNAFRNWNLTIPAPASWAGVQNFVRLFNDGRFWNALSNTAVLTVVGIILQVILGMAIAMALRGKFRGRRAIIGLILIPVLVAPVVAGTAWKFMFSYEFGLINYWLGLIGIHGPLWLSSSRFWGLMSILIVDTWQWTPFVALVFLAGLEGVPKSIYEAAAVDGAKSLRVFLQLTLPALKSLFVLIILLRTIFIFKIYDVVVSLTQGGPGVSTESMSLFTYYMGMKHFDIGYTMSAAVIQIIIMIIVANVFMKIAKSST